MTEGKQPIDIIYSVVDRLAGYIEPAYIAEQILTELQEEGFSIRKEEGI